MHSRFLAGWKGLLLAAAVASLILLPSTGTFAATPAASRVAGGLAPVSIQDDSSRVTHPTLFPRANYLWPYSTGPFYGEVDDSQWSAKGVLHLAVGSFNTSLGLPNIPTELRTNVKLGQLPAQYFLLQVDPSSLSDGSFARLRNQITTQGGAFLQSMAVAGFIVRLTPASYSAIQGDSSVLFLEPYHPAFKLSPYIGRVPLADPAKALSSVYSVTIAPFAGEDITALAQAVAAAGASVTQVRVDVVKADVPREKLARIAAIESVYSIEEDIPVGGNAEETTTTMQTGHYNLGATPFHDVGVNGGGNGIAAGPQVLMELDTGIQLDAGDLSNTKTSSGTAGATHRKVLAYQTTNAWGGSGDLLGCDAPQSGGFTHGHVVASTALGNASVTPASYGGSWFYVDPNSGKQWKIDGVAPRAQLTMYDCSVTTTLTACDNPGNGANFTTGTIYARPANPTTSSMADGYVTYGARTYNFSWGASSPSPVYGTQAAQVDQFLFDQKDAMLFISAGNAGTDSDRNLVPDPGTVWDPATCKNCTVVGASDETNDGGIDYTKYRATFTSKGPATTTSARIAPILMAPGNDVGSLGPASEFACKTSDNDQNDPVQCDVTLGASGTSFASPAAAGAAMLVRDYFAQGFYPDGTSTNSANNADKVPNVSGALVKAILIASADFMDQWNLGSTWNLARYRFSNDDGYGRIQLNNALPLQTYPSPTGLIVADGGITGGVNNTSFSGTASNGVTETYTFNISDTSKELRIALAWVEDSGETLSNDLDLELVAPSGKTYYGNYFTDDNNRDGAVSPSEDCAISPFESANVVDSSRWSLPTCANSVRDTKNPTEAIMLSPDFFSDGTNVSQLEPGLWTLKVIGRTVVAAGGQKYAVAIAGPVQLGSSTRLDPPSPTCNGKVRVFVEEYADATDPLPLTVGEVASRTTLQVIDAGPDGVFDTGDDIVVDTETNLTFTQPDPINKPNEYVSSYLNLTSNTAPDPGNGALDVRDGQRIKVVYADKTSGVPDSNKVRFNTTVTNCHANFNFGGVVFGMFGRDLSVFVNGGCERDARGMFTFGYPDQYMDHGEMIDLSIAVQNAETVDLVDAQASLRAVFHDADSPENCKPYSSGICTDPNRTNNTPVPSNILTVLDSPKIIGTIPSAYSPNVNQTAAPVFSISFTIQMGATISGKQDVDLILGLSAKKAGKPVDGIAVYRTTLNANETALYYSTDFPTGGTQVQDWNNNESLENPTTFLGDINFQFDYRFENLTGALAFSDLTAGGTKNTAIQSPWNFDANDGGFRSGLNATTNTNIATVIALWGEDKNFNGVLDAGEDRDPVNGVLDENWSTKGGCGWQTKGLNPTTGGIWHTGRIDVTTLSTCIDNTTGSAQCKFYDTYPGTTAKSWWLEMLHTPIVAKVNQGVDPADPDPTPRQQYRTQFTNWAWNMAIDLKDTLAVFTWEFDTDADKTNPISLDSDTAFFNAASGKFGTVSGGNAPLSNGFPVFADFAGTGTAASKNGTVGGNHEGKNSCFFEQSASRNSSYGFALPKDDDARNGWCDNTSRPSDKQTSCTAANQATVCAAPTYHGVCAFDATTSTDQFVLKNGPLRNFNLRVFNGFIDGRFYTLEDIYGEDGVNYQGAVGFWVFEGTTSTQPGTSYGVGVDDMVVEWKESRLDEDTTTNCAANGACATIDLNTGSFYNGLARLDITVTDKSPGAPGTGVNDCNHNGVYTDPGDTNDCDGNGTPDVVVNAYNLAEPNGEWVICNQTSTPGVFKGSLPISSTFDSPGTLFVQRSGTQTATVNVKYADPNDGTGGPCKGDPDPTKWGVVLSGTTVYIPTGNVVVKGSRITNDAGKGDGDGFADTNETVNMFITVSNKSGEALTNVVARLSTNSSNIDCIINPLITLSSLAKDATVEITAPFVFKVSSAVNRTDPNADVSAPFNITLSADQFDASLAPQQIVQDLDLDITGGSGSGTYSESFEGGTFGTFTSMTMDVGLNTNTLSNGQRCQYSDPDFVNSNSYGETQCYLGFAGALAVYNQFNWHVHKTSNGDQGRAYVGTNSLHWGYHPISNPDNDESEFSQMDAIRMLNPVNLGYTPVTAANPELSFKHQASFMDFRRVNALYMQAPDRGVVELQLADSAGNPVGVWQKLYPYTNIYDIQTSNNYINCLFDPADDGNNEDSYFSPTDPNRRFGPSSTCFPEFNFGSIGDADYRNKFTAGNTGRASDDHVGLKGSIDRGTWVQSNFNLERYRGRRARVRFIATSIKVYDYPDPISIGFPNKSPIGVGWYIDDIQISNTLATAATITADTKASSSFPACPGNCTVVTPSLTATPASLGAPGLEVALFAGGSSADACIGGTLQYRFWIDNNNNNQYDVGTDTLLRDWSDNASWIDAPTATTKYGVNIRCSSAQSCIGTTTNSVSVTCPSSGNLKWIGPLNVGKTGGLGGVEPDQNLTISWATSQFTDAIRGDLIALRTLGTFTGSVLTCDQNDQTISSFTDNTVLATGGGFYFLARTPPGGFCNVLSTYSTGAPKERAGRDSQIAADANHCP